MSGCPSIVRERTVSHGGAPAGDVDTTARVPGHVAGEVRTRDRELARCPDARAGPIASRGRVADEVGSGDHDVAIATDRATLGAAAVRLIARERRPRDEERSVVRDATVMRSHVLFERPPVQRQGP